MDMAYQNIIIMRRRVPRTCGGLGHTIPGEAVRIKPLLACLYLLYLLLRLRDAFNFPQSLPILHNISPFFLCNVTNIEQKF